MNSHEVVVIGGIPGVGKSTVLEQAVKRLKERGKSYAVVNFGDVMLEIAKKENLVNHRDELRKLDPKMQKEIQRMAAKHISSLSTETNVIVDTHITISTPNGYLPGLPLWVLEELEPTRVIIIEADPQEIYERRKKDESRVRDMESLESIGMHQNYNRYVSAVYCVISGATVGIVKNKQGRILDAVNDLVKYLE